MAEPKRGKHSIIAELAGENKKILELGCGGGAISSVLQKKGNKITGIEIGKESAEKARKYCERVIIADIESPSTAKKIKEKFDLIVFSEVLEHLRQPKEVLQKYKKFLKKEGAIIACIPNTAHWSVRLSLLAGKWDYTEGGLLDKTHLRFFTLKTAKELIEGSGYRITHFYCTHYMRNPLAFHSWNFLVSVFPSLFGFQAIIKAIPKTASGKQN